ncbi:hypothetical protein JMUB7556_28400 [Staphylococcus aureus]
MGSDIFFKQKTAYAIAQCLVGSEMCIRDSDTKRDGQYMDEASCYRTELFLSLIHI